MSNVLARWRTLRRTATLVVVLGAWWGCGTVAIVMASNGLTDAAAPYPAVIAFLAVGTATAIVSLVLLWVMASEIRFVRRGYRIRPMRRQVIPVTSLHSGGWVYEERASDGRIRSLPFTRVVLSNGYPARTEVRFPVGEEWDTRSPAWARGRRAQIVDRVVECAGGSFHTQVLDGKRAHMPPP